METCKCGKLLSEIKPGHYGSCKDYKEYLKEIEESITYDFLYKEYIEDGKSLTYIATELGLNKTRILERKLIEFNIPKRTLQEAKKQKHHVELAKQTSLERYGVEFHLQSGSELREKGLETIKEKYGVDNVMYANDIIEQRKEYFIKKYGVDNPYGNKDIREKIKNTNVERYGVDNPWKLKEIQNKCLESKLKSNTNTTYYSKKSQEIFWNIYNQLDDSIKEHTYFAELNKEFGKNDVENNKYYFYDFVITNLKIAIEYNGDYYHANPNKYNESFYNKHLKLEAKDIWIKDKIKNDYITNLGYDILIIWESDDIDTKIEEIVSYIRKKGRI